MATQKKTAKSGSGKKSQGKMRDLKPTKDAKGGGVSWRPKNQN